MMKNASRRMALCGMMCALAVVVMSLGGMIPMATFCCPAFAGLTLVPLVVDCGKKMALGAWIAVAFLSLILCPDKEAALLFAFLGHYPVVKWRLDMIKQKWPRRLAKFLVLDGCIGLLYIAIFFVLRMDQIMADYKDATAITLFLLFLLGNFTLALYDRLLMIGAYLYIKKMRPKLFKHQDQ